MNILVILRNIYSNPDLFDDEQYLCKSDYNVLAESIILKEHFIGQVTALLFTENVSDNIETLKKACTYGADAACLIGFERFDFSETEQLSQIMAETIRTYFPDYDLILFGRLAYDGDAVNVSTQVSCHLGIPRVVYSREIYTKDQVLYARKYISSSKEAIYRLKRPVLIQSIREQGVTRQTKIADIIRTYQDMTIQHLDGNAIAAGLSSAKTGLHLIQKTEPPKDKSTSMTLLNGLSDDESAANLLRILREKGFQGRRKR